MANDEGKAAKSDVIREVRSLTELMRASIDQLVDEFEGRSVSRTRMKGWDATFGTYRLAGSWDEVQDQVRRLLGAKGMAASALISKLALQLAVAEDSTMAEVIDRVERQVIEDLDDTSMLDA